MSATFVGPTPAVSGMIIDSPVATVAHTPQKASRSKSGFVEGDLAERKYWPLFIKEKFPSYKIYWEKFVKPLRTSGTIYIDDAINDNLSYNAQLHYSVLHHLGTAYKIKRRKTIDRDSFAFAIGSICSALDVANELIARVNNPDLYQPFNQKDAHRAQTAGLEKPDPMYQIRNYRNTLIHNALLPIKKKFGTHKTHTYVPTIDRIDDYRDWRKVTNSSYHETDDGYGEIRTVLSDMWEAATSYIESRWQSQLLRTPTK